MKEDLEILNSAYTIGTIKNIIYDHAKNVAQ
jgi:hypothetical protein